MEIKLSDETFNTIYNSFSIFLTNNEKKHNLTREQICEVILSYIDVNTTLIEDLYTNNNNEDIDDNVNYD